MFLGDIEKRALGCYGLKSSFGILLCDTYDRTLIDYVEFLKDTLNTFYTSNMKSIMQFTVPGNAEVNTAEGNITLSFFKIFYY